VQSLGRVQGLWEPGQRVEVGEAGKRAQDQEGHHLQTGVVRRCCPSLQTEMVGEPDSMGLNGDGMLAVPSYHLVESVLQESEQDLTCYW
jgi:hypothetical protein